MQPGALVLDEPSAHLDPRSATQLYHAVHSVADATGATVVLVEHDLDRVVPRHVTRGLLLDRDGRLAADGTIQDVFCDAERALIWQADGVRLPTATALALALALEAGLSSERLPISVDEGGRWLADRPWAQRALRAASARRSSLWESPGDVVIQASGVWQRFVAPATSTLALQDVALTIAAGELVAVVGANGSGKTSLLRTLTGLLVPERGEVEIAGVNLRGTPARQVAGLVAHVFQNPEAGFVASTVEDELAYSPRALAWSEPEISRHVGTLLERFGLASLARANPFTLSEGQKRRLSVAASLVLGPHALLLDEPTFGQDRQSAQALMDELAALRAQGLAIVVATHDLGLVAEYATRVVALVGGHVVFDGSPADLIASDALLEQTGQEAPALDQIMLDARSRGADLPPSLRWRDMAGIGTVSAV